MINDKYMNISFGSNPLYIEITVIMIAIIKTKLLICLIKKQNNKNDTFVTIFCYILTNNIVLSKITLL